MPITPQLSSSPIQIIALSRFESESLLAPEPSTSFKLLLVNWRRDLVTAQQLAYMPSPPTAQMLIMPQPSSSPILLPKGVREQNGNPLAVPQLLAAACQMRIPPGDGFRPFVNNATTLATALAAPNSPCPPTSDKHSSSSFIHSSHISPLNTAARPCIAMLHPSRRT